MKRRDVRHCPRGAWLALWLAALGLAGCGSATNLNVKDSAATHYSMRATYRLSGAPGRGGLEVEHASASGSDVQHLLDTESVALGGQTIFGPTDLRNDAKVQHTHLVYNHLLFADRPVQMEWFAGLADVRLQWDTVASAAAQPPLRKVVSWVGPTAGIGTRWKVSDLFALEGRVAAATTRAIFAGNYKSSGELALVLMPVRQLRLRVGYAESTTWVDNDAVGDSGLSFKTRGPFLGLALEFF